MPFLRAALIHKKAEEREHTNILPPIVVVPEEPEILPETESENVHEEAESLTESENVHEEAESLTESANVHEEAEPLTESANLHEEAEPLTESENVHDESDSPDELGQVPNTEDSSDAFNNLPAEILAAVTDDEPQPQSEPEPSDKYSGETLNYDFTSGERYVDKVSTKTEFDKMLDELSAISKDLLSREVEKFAVKFTSKFQGDFDKAEADAKKYEAFLGGFITNAAMTLYENGYRDSAVKQLEQAKGIIEASKRLEEETQAIRDRVEEEDATVDLSDILGLFGD